MVPGWFPFKIVSNLNNRYKSAERKIQKKQPEHMLNYSLPCSCSSNLSSFWLILKQQWTIVSSGLLSAVIYRLCKLGIFRLKIAFKSSPLKPLNQIKPNLAGMVPGWLPFKIVSNRPSLHSRWLLWKVLKFRKFDETRGSQEPVIAHLDQSCFQ
jgi:hypothetical protein